MIELFTSLEIQTLEEMGFVYNERLGLFVKNKAKFDSRESYIEFNKISCVTNSSFYYSEKTCILYILLYENDKRIKSIIKNTDDIFDFCAKKCVYDEFCDEFFFYFENVGNKIILEFMGSRLELEK